MELFLPRQTAVNDYTYTVPQGYRLAYVNIYIDAVSGVSHTVSLNGITTGLSTQNTRENWNMIVTAGDVIKVKRETGSSDPWHTGYIRKIF